MPVSITEGPPEPVLVVLRPERGTLRVSGAEAKTWLNGLITCDVTKVGPGQGAFGLALNKQGKIQSEVVVVATAEGLLLGVSEGVAEPLAAALDKFLVMEDAELSHVSNDHTWADFHGLGAAALAETAAHSCGGFSAVMNFTDRSGASLVFERERSLELTRYVERAPTLRLATDEEWESFRIAQGLGRFGVDFGQADNPHEAALDRRAVSWSKGCYLGQEVVCMQDMRGKLKRRLVTLALSGSGDLPAVGSVVTTADGAEPVGEVTSVARGPASAHTSEAGLALARLKSPFFEGTAPLAVAGWGAAFVAPRAAEMG